ncbi:N-acetyllactosaminide beta-1,6-N-acetylglucosaminyl-transferase-like [Dreissena polymorpha]|uniref:Beta-1,3-galactosyl-O-glycosyl-glycoprotein beta-1,6-N-acetylglucosaminyltransferase n=1 Tax=Dreissena polymorpha TaxID=45954 RepID=A0A9D4LFC5_DREPO|nr:N-acetyllactosaminide beta-1,6-N-acetylglucosaminyl-transferase-like [Dreissena polymorpha]XP_052270286.1 N-acetyllactosaminide beta-1,6-N-acetylglucosaminyl-transferase-like [Dreissena polymorpha]KAH3857510.1 hypothetical protein DPMN_100119 [Dreissena polymorpha]
MDLLRSWCKNVLWFMQKYPKIFSALLFLVFLTYRHQTKFGPVYQKAPKSYPNIEKQLTPENTKCDIDKQLEQSREVCDQLFSALKLSTDVAEKSYSEKLSRGCSLEDAIENCSALKAALLFGKKRIQADETGFPLAFAIKIHRDENQAFRLLRYIYRTHNVYCIHVDAKASHRIFDAFKRIQACTNNVFVIDDPVDVVYSSIRQVEAELKCMKLMKMTSVSWKYYINLTGQEFMLKSNAEIIHYLRKLNGTNDIESYPLPENHLYRIGQVHTIQNGKIVKTSKKKEHFRLKLNIRKGSAYGLFSREFVNYLLNHPTVKLLKAWLEDTYAPEELVWATINALADAPGGDVNERTYANGKFQCRAVKWRTDASIKCHGKYVHDVCIYGVKDLLWLLQSDFLIANKFYEEFEAAALTCLETAMYSRLLQS